MKNNKILYLIIVCLVTLFSFNMKVDAVEQLSCIYDNNVSLEVGKVYAYKLFQSSNGSLNFYVAVRNNEGSEWSQFDDWYKYERYYEFPDNKMGQVKSYDVSFNVEYGSLSSCPKYFYFNSEDKESLLNFVDDVDGDVTASNLITSYPYYSYNNFNGVINSELDYEPTEKEMKSGDVWLLGLSDSRYTGSCLYGGYYEEKHQKEEVYHLVQVNFGMHDLVVSEYDPKKGWEYSGFSQISKYNFRHSGNRDNTYIMVTADTYLFEISDDAHSDFMSAEGYCLPTIKVETDKNINSTTVERETAVYMSGNKGETYYLINARGNNPINDEELSVDKKFTAIILPSADIESCADLFGEKVAGIFETIWNIVKILIPILLVVFGGIDFAQAVFAGKEDDMKKAQAKFIKRIIIAVIIFVIPVLLGFLLNIANNIWGNIGTDICGILA